MEKEIIKLNSFVAFYAVTNNNSEIPDWKEEWNYREEDSTPEINYNESKNYKLVDTELIGSDDEDGGWEKRSVIQRLSDNKFFAITFQEWDVDWEKGDIKNWIAEFEEVFPEEKTIIIYK